MHPLKAPWRNGRRSGLKIRGPLPGVWVRLPPGPFTFAPHRDSIESQGAQTFAVLVLLAGFAPLFTPT